MKNGLMVGHSLVSGTCGTSNALPNLRPDLKLKPEIAVLTNYLKIALRNLLKNKGYSAINIGGLAVGMAVAMLIGLWIYDEISFNRYHKNYGRIVQVYENQHISGGIETFSALPIPLSTELRKSYGLDFEKIAATTTSEQIVAAGDKRFSRIGIFTESLLPEILSLEMVSGTQTALNDPNAILISESFAHTLFGSEDPVNKPLKLNNTYQLKVAGVYKDIPKNSRFNELQFMAPVELLFPGGISSDAWYSNSFQIYASLNANYDLDAINKKIAQELYKFQKDASKPSIFLMPMSRWHLYGDFVNGVNTGGRIQFVWLFGMIGAFVLLLACINFMNLSTARSEKRSKEVGVRKVVGSVRGQLIAQFFSESFLVVIFAFALSILLSALTLPFFNELSDKEMVFLWSNPFFWICVTSFSILTGLISGSYPALYLSSFQPLTVLKGTFKAGRFAAVPRKVLLVVQFTVSVTLIIGTIVVFRQIMHAKDRPVGYSREGLITIPLTTSEIHDHYRVFREELMQTNMVAGVAESFSPMTGVWSSANNLDWPGKDPAIQASFGTVSVDPDFGKVVSWDMKEGRNFSTQFPSDSSGFIFNEAAIKQMRLTDPIDKMIKWHGKNWKVLGVVKDMVMKSPFEPIMPTVFMMDNRERPFNVVNIKIRPGISLSQALSKIETVFKKHAMATPFDYKFASQEYENKFAAEQRIGKLATSFAILAIFISCLGLFGLASFMTEQRTKEIGIRKVLGASVANLWQLLSKDFVMLVIISCVIAAPTAYYFMEGWLEKYEYRTEISWWIFALSTGGALVVTLLTVSFQAVKAALVNPVKSLKGE